MLKSRFIQVLRNWPGRRRFGDYAFLPIFFTAGAVMELMMNVWRPFGVNFYSVLKRNRVEELAQDQVEKELLRRSILQQPVVRSGVCIHFSHATSGIENFLPTASPFHVINLCLLFPCFFLPLSISLRSHY